MRFFEEQEVRDWCERRGLRVTAGRFLYYDADDLHCFSIGLEESPSRIIALADYLVPTWQDVPFEGALLWIRERGIWGDFSETIGATIIKEMRLAKGEPEPIEKRPGQLFGHQELFEMHSYLVIPMLFGWDAFLVPEGKDYFLFVSHDGIVGVVSRTQQTYNHLYQRVLDWNPHEDRGWYAKGTGIPSEHR
jgi:hypothetical protein